VHAGSATGSPSLSREICQGLTNKILGDFDNLITVFKELCLAIRCILPACRGKLGPKLLSLSDQGLDLRQRRAGPFAVTAREMRRSCWSCSASSTALSSYASRPIPSPCCLFITSTWISQREPSQKATAIRAASNTRAVASICFTRRCSGIFCMLIAVMAAGDCAALGREGRWSQCLSRGPPDLRLRRAVWLEERGVMRTRRDAARPSGPGGRAVTVLAAGPGIPA
jgi:hypothetical protein